MHFYYSTFPNKEKAIEIGKKLVAEKKIACMNVLGEGTAVYEWKEKAEVGSECFAILKSGLKFESLWAIFHEIHPYETPCLIELDTKNVNPDFNAWVYEQSGE